MEHAIEHDRRNRDDGDAQRDADPVPADPFFELPPHGAQRLEHLIPRWTFFGFGPRPEPTVKRGPPRPLERDDFPSNRHPARLLLEHDLFRKPASTFRDHALAE